MPHILHMRVCFNAHNSHLWACDNPPTIHKCGYPLYFRVNVWGLELLGTLQWAPTCSWQDDCTVISWGYRNCSNETAWSGASSCEAKLWFQHDSDPVKYGTNVFLAVVECDISRKRTGSLHRTVMNFFFSVGTWSQDYRRHQASQTTFNANMLKRHVQKNTIWCPVSAGLGRTAAASNTYCNYETPTVWSPSSLHHIMVTRILKSKTWQDISCTIFFTYLLKGNHSIDSMCTNFILPHILKDECNGLDMYPRGAHFTS